MELNLGTRNFQRVQQYFISAHGLHELLQTGQVVQIANGLPKDARIIMMTPDTGRMGFWIVVESDTFLECPPSCIAPRGEITGQFIVAIENLDPPLPLTVAEYEARQFYATESHEA